MQTCTHVNSLLWPLKSMSTFICYSINSSNHDDSQLDQHIQVDIDQFAQLWRAPTLSVATVGTSLRHCLYLDQNQEDCQPSCLSSLGFGT